MEKNDPIIAVPQNQAIPLTATPANAANEFTQRRYMRDSNIQVMTPAATIVSALATKGLGDAAFKNNLGTPRPSEIMVGVDATNTYMYMVPVRPNTPGATQVKYDGGRAFFNLYTLFAKLDRLVQEDVREYYQTNPTPGEVTIGAVKGWGLYIKLSDVIKEPISHLSEEEKARRAAKRRQSAAAKKAAKANQQESAPATEETQE